MFLPQLRYHSLYSFQSAVVPLQLEIKYHSCTSDANILKQRPIITIERECKCSKYTAIHYKFYLECFVVFYKH